MLIFFITCSSLDAIAPRRQKTRKRAAFFVDRSAPRTEAWIACIIVIFLILFSHLKGFMSPLGGPQSEPSPPQFFPSLLSNPPFSLQIPPPGLFKQQSGGRGMGKVGGGMTGLCTHPHTPSPAPTWAYPCCLLLLPILAASASPQHLTLRSADLQKAGMEGANTVAKLSAPNHRPSPPIPRRHPRPASTAPFPGSPLPCRNSEMISHRS